MATAPSPINPISPVAGSGNRSGEGVLDPPGADGDWPGVGGPWAGKPPFGVFGKFASGVGWVFTGWFALPTVVGGTNDGAGDSWLPGQPTQ